MKVKISDIFDFEKGALQSSKCVIGEYDFITASSDWKKHNVYTHECEALIIAVAASGSLGRTHYVNGKFIASDLCFILQPKAEFKEKINLKFYYEYFNFIKDDLVYKTATGSAKKAINKLNFAQYEIIFPNKEYQDKIIQKLCEFKKYFGILNENFEYDAKLVDKLRQSILQDAIQGKLVPQNPNDEPASELLERIRVEKEQLIKAGKIKKEKCIIIDNKYEIVIPKNWCMCVVQDISLKVTDGEHSTPQRVNSGYFLLSARNVTNQGLKLDNVDYVDESEFNRIRKRCNPNKNDVLMSCSGSVGRVCLVDKDNCYVMVRSVAMVRPHKNIYPKYLVYVLKSDFLQKQIEKSSKITAQANLFLGKIIELQIPLPPTEEQKRIVARVDELMLLCDKLELENNNAQKSSSDLLQSIMQKYFTPEV
ncbi:MAG: restriction endonuclease subunit S [Candidatus Gastranaerophilales bacterium]|nr:restriction endonuclease subunit S [Candidatus Gastranaerophilales bacterium]